ncbi:MAG TPA: lysophospholipid acyltransferase family protein [Tepidisphaeraceae bacterium]|jgi:KDO2-lipid IV(A) lauroyltransferase
MKPAAHDVWLRGLFALAGRAPWTLAALRPAVVRAAPRIAPAVGRHTRANARRIFDERPPGDFSCHVIGQFYDFVRDIGSAQHETAQQLCSHVVAVEGEPAYLATRAAGRGAVLVTAHMGSFEVGLAALRQKEPCVHVVFKRDTFGGFESLRRRVRATLGVHEAAIDDGLPVLMRLRDALRDNGVVVMQGDRAMPGQKSAVVPFLKGHLRLPLGPLKLAEAAGSPVVPVFTVREGPGRFRVWLEPAIDPTSPHALRQLADTIARFVRRYPTQWLVLHKAFVEDETE